MLVGNGSYDYRGYLAPGTSLLPPRLVVTPDGLYASDSWYADVAGDDGVPEMAVGRIPASSPAEVEDYVAKLRDQVAGAWQQLFVFVAGAPDEAGDFPSDAVRLAGLDNALTTRRCGSGRGAWHGSGTAAAAAAWNAAPGSSPTSGTARGRSLPAVC